jgi:hypothetical protein
MLGSGLTGGMSNSIGVLSGDNGDNIPAEVGAGSLGGAVPSVGINRVGTGSSVLPVDGRRATCRVKDKHVPV